MIKVKTYKFVLVTIAPPEVEDSKDSSVVGIALGGVLGGVLGGILVGIVIGAVGTLLITKLLTWRSKRKGNDQQNEELVCCHICVIFLLIYYMDTCKVHNTLLLV